MGRPALAAESPPADVFVRAQIDELADVLTGGAPNRFEVLRARVRAVADFDGFAAKALGKTWGTLAAEEQQRFKTAMQGLLESHYMNKPGAIFDKNKVVVKEATPKDGSAAVRLTLKRKDVDVGVVVKVHPGPGAWIVDDVVIDGLSLLEDYRSQFQTFLKKKTVAELIAKLDAKAKANLGKKN
ncbi:MAG: ABC transporter substrate-binding protein [Deltaproteobacteria bacterium]|nr:ABC transporter substrate-binding protein [Deltaproteobacteria bacterium]